MKTTKTNNKKTTKLFLFFVLNIALISAFANALSFYEGDVSIELIDTKLTIDSSGNSLNAVINYTFSGSDSVDIDFFGLPDNAVVNYNGQLYGKSLQINPAESNNALVTYSQQLGEGTIKGVSFNPDAYFDGIINPNRIKNVVTTLETPYKLISHSSNPSSKEEGPQNTYVWSSTFSYISTLTLTYSTQGSNIEVIRIVPNDIKDIFTVQTIVTNKGSKADNIVLVTSFMPSDFSPASKLDEFETIQDGNDLRIEWKKEIPSLSAGQEVTFTYDLKVNNDQQNTVLRPVLVYVNDVLAAVAKKVEFTTEFEGTASDPLLRETINQESESERSTSEVPPELIAPPFEDLIEPGEEEAEREPTDEAEEGPIEEGRALTDAEKEILEKRKKEERAQKIKDSLKNPTVQIVLAIVIIAVLALIYRNRKRGQHNGREGEKQIAHARLHDYVMEAKRKGYSEEQIRIKLHESNIHHKVIEKHLNHAYK